MHPPQNPYLDHALEESLCLGPLSPALSTGELKTSATWTSGEIPIMLFSDSYRRIDPHDSNSQSSSTTAQIDRINEFESPKADQITSFDWDRQVSGDFDSIGRVLKTLGHTRHSLYSSDGDDEEFLNTTFGPVAKVIGGSDLEEPVPIQLPRVDDLAHFDSASLDGNGNCLGTAANALVSTSSKDSFLSWKGNIDGGNDHSSSSHLDSCAQFAGSHTPSPSQQCQQRSPLRRQLDFQIPGRRATQHEQESQDCEVSACSSIPLLYPDHGTRGLPAKSPYHRGYNLSELSLADTHYRLATQQLHALQPSIEIQNPIPTCTTQADPIIDVTHESHLSEMSLQMRRLFPDHQSWLKDIIVDLLIDQEGFRNVRASFKLSGYSVYAGSEVLSVGFDQFGVAEFMPVIRQRFNFHYAPFDGVPKLRRVVVNGNESRDYISREAILGIKDNGVYTVRGAESPNFSFSGDHDGQPPGDSARKLMWKFDYLVGDRILRKTGRILDGEKTITPLTFSCSPLLLHPAQGRKIHFMQVFWKNLSPSLKPQKMDPPHSRAKGLSSPTKKAGGTSDAVGAGQAHFALRSVTFGRHRRSRSHTPFDDNDTYDSQMKMDPHIPAVPSKLSDSLVAPPDREHSKQETGRRRRASSAGERIRTLSKAEDAHAPHTSIRQNKQVQETHASASRPRHIVPRSQLTEMLESVNDPSMGFPVTPLSPYKSRKASVRRGSRGGGPRAC